MQDDPISNIIANIKDINERNEADTRHELDHEELIQSNLQTGEVVAKSFRSLVAYLENRISKTEVVNQLSSIGTPDVFAVVLALEELHNTLKTHENTDLTEVTNTMKGVLEEVSKLPKELPTFEQKDYVAQFDSLTNAIKSVEKVVKAQKLVAEAPKVTVEAPRITVEQNEVDISALENELQTSRKEFTKAIKSIVIPETDTKGIEKQLKSIDKLLNEFLDAPRGGGGGGGRATPYETADGMPKFITVGDDGTIPVSVSGGTSPLNAYSYIQKDTTDTVYKYYGYADGNTAGAWAIKRITISTNLAEYVKGTTGYTAAWTARDDGSTHTYADLWTTF